MPSDFAAGIEAAESIVRALADRWEFGMVSSDVDRAADEIASLTPTASEATAIGAGEAVGAMLICDQIGGRMFTAWPVAEYEKQRAASLYDDRGGYRTVPLYAASPKVASDTAPGVDRAIALVRRIASKESWQSHYGRTR